MSGILPGPHDVSLQAVIPDRVGKLHRSLDSLLVGLAALTAGLSGFAAESAPPVVLANALVRVEAAVADGQLHERYLARRGDAWIPVAEAGSPAGPVVLHDATSGQPVRATRVTADTSGLTEEFEVPGGLVTRVVQLQPDSPWLRIATTFHPSAPTTLHHFVDRLLFLGTPDWSYAPSIGGFVPDLQYKAPVVLFQTGGRALGIVPDLTQLDRATLQRCGHALDLDVRPPATLAVGFQPARMAAHSVFASDSARQWRADAPVTNAYYLLVMAAAKPDAAYREAVRLHWRLFGQPTQRIAATQQRGTPTPAPLYDWIRRLGTIREQVETDRRLPTLALWDDWRRLVWQDQTRQNWLTLPLPGGATGGGVWTHRWGPGPSIYLSSWFNTLRTSLGLALYARRTGDHELLHRATATLEVALRAPGREGAFKCVGAWDEANQRVAWAAGDGSGEGVETGYLGYDMSWTGYWLLRWRAAGLPGQERILPRCRALADFLVSRQAEDGMLPTRFAEDGSVLAVESRQVKAETGPVALFLLELHAQEPDPRWLRAALAGLAFLDRDVVPARQWYDYETFWSCSPRGALLDARTGQWPANNLALGQAVAAYLAAYRATAQSTYLERGERLLDYLLLYQQCWTNPVLEDLTGPAMLLGGFTTQNADAEWSDARQSQFGNVLLDYHRATGKPEYLERGVAALRAQFPVSPSENWAHSGGGGKSGISSFHWGTGSGLAGIELEEEYLRDGVVDVAAAVAVGVNGLNFGRCTVADGEIRLELATPFAWPRPPVLAFHHVRAGQLYHVVVNGVGIGAWPGEELARGLPLDLARVLPR